MIHRSQFFPLLALTLAFIPPPPAQAFSGSRKQAEQAGAILFRDKGCAYCHGLTAAGTAKAPSLAAVRKTLKPAQITDQIENGGQKMPAFKESLSDAEVAQLVAWLRAKHRPIAPPKPAPLPQNTPVSNPSQ